MARLTLTAHRTKTVNHEFSHHHWTDGRTRGGCLGLLGRPRPSPPNLCYAPLLLLVRRHPGLRLGRMPALLNLRGGIMPH